MMQTLNLAVVLGLLVSVASGCGSGSSINIVEGGGTVTYKGRPLAGAIVTFVPEKGPIATGVTNLEGKFTLSTGGKPGVAVGPAKVSVEAYQGESREEAAADFSKTASPEDQQAMQKQMMEQMLGAGKKGSQGPNSIIPAKYAKTDSSGLAFTVSERASENDFSIELKR